MALKGFAALTMVPCTDGNVRPVYAGQPVPTHVVPEHRDRLLREGFIVDDVDGTVDYVSWQTARDEENAAWRATQQERAS